MKNRVKLLLVTEATTGGAYKHLLQLATNLDRDKFEISVLLSPLRNPDCLNDARLLEQLGITCYVIPMKREIAPLSDLTAFYRVYQLLKSSPQDLVHFHSSKAGFLGRMAAWFAKTPGVIYTPHCYYFEAKKGIARFFYKKIEQFAARATSYIINISEGEHKVTINEKIIPENKTRLIKNAIEIKDAGFHYNTQAIREKYGISQTDKVVAGVGRLSAQKDWVCFIKIARRILLKRTGVVFLIIGEGECRTELTKLIGKYGLTGKILLPGFVNNTNEIYAMSNLVLNTSLWEGISYVLLEAMQFKLPVIATDIPGNEDVVFQSKNGYLFKPGDDKAGAEAVERLLGDKKKREELGNNGFAHVCRNHSMAKFIARHEHLYLGKTSLIEDLRVHEDFNK